MSDLLLRPPTLDDEQEALAASEELTPDGFQFLLADGDWAAQLEQYRREAAGDVPADRVPCDFLVAVVDGTIVGRASIRHELNDWLLRCGGHIGYGVRPQFRRRGYATEILRQSLARLHELGVEKALVTCDDDNVGSARTIERCGGVLEDVVPGPGDSPQPKRRYWVPTAPAGR